MFKLFVQTLILYLSIVAIFTQNGDAQEIPIKYYQGFEKEVSGFTLNYHSPLPEVNASLLVRANKEFQPIVWETEAVGKNETNEFVFFTWMFGMDADVKKCHFDLYVNDVKYIGFSTPSEEDQEERSFEGRNNSKLTLLTTFIDKYHDHMGYATLRLALSDILPGKPVTLAVKGMDAGSNIWYMTFKTGLFEKVKIHQESAVLKENGELFHIARFDFTHLGPDENAIIKVNNLVDSCRLKAGYNSLTLKIPKEEIKKSYVAQLKIGDKPAKEISFDLDPVKEWSVYLVQHSHTDIGYTRSQTEILPEHLRYIDYALDYCDQTDDYPADAQFRWTCEASWPVREYLRSRPEPQIQRLKERVQEGRIEISAMFFNYSEIVDEASLAAQTKVLKEFKDKGLEVKLAMQNDINGIGWCLADYFSGAGLNYLIMGEHGHRARIPFEIPTAFWWESPSGKRLLAFRAEHYMYGNTLGLTSGDELKFRKNLTSYLDDLSEKGYPHLQTALQFSGYITDNSPPSITASDLVKTWNEKYEWPKLRIATASEFMQYIEENCADDLPVKRQAWPDWWVDGCASAMIETGASRKTHGDIIANNGILSMAYLMGAKIPDNLPTEIEAIQDAILFYDEHTYGAAESISEPLTENTVVQWNEKSAYVWEAVKKSAMMREKAIGLIQPYIPTFKIPSLTVFNTTNHPRSGLVELYIDHEILPVNKKFQIIENMGNSIPVQQITSRSDGTYWGLWVEDIPPFGFKSFRIIVTDEYRTIDSAQEEVEKFENDFYRFGINAENGVITSLTDKDLNIELVDSSAEYQFGQFIYERLANRHQMERYTYNKIDTVYVPLQGERLTLGNTKILKVENGPVWNSLFIQGEIPVCANQKGLTLEIRLFHHVKQIEFHYSMVKLAVTEPEAVYVAFPFHHENSQITFDVQGGMVHPGINQLEGTSSDWSTMQNFVSLNNGRSQIVLGSIEVPLVQFGDINTGRYYYNYIPKRPHIYSWVLNNYWTTNFRASQEGEMNWSYYITSTADTSKSFAARFGSDGRIPLIARVLPAGREDGEQKDKTILNLDYPGVILVNASPSINGKGVVLQLRETDGVSSEIETDKIFSRSSIKTISVVNVLEEPLQINPQQIKIEALATLFLLVEK
ncbi:MAG: hypothetical protein K9G76_09590 [Bacteroidales bacterium]|nr:hypothetical protein [Bacteroidales bacterium]MCF8403950.1 hypothetical protein [Bacteroidales bacterium]